MKEGSLVVHKKYGVGIILEMKEVYSSWGHPNTWYKVVFANLTTKDKARWMAKNNLELLDESG